MPGQTDASTGKHWYILVSRNIPFVSRLNSDIQGFRGRGEILPLVTNQYYDTNITDVHFLHYSINQSIVNKNVHTDSAQTKD